MKRSLFIGRFQPFHLGHLSVVEEMQSEEFDEIIVGIGSAQYNYVAGNPFTADERSRMVCKSVKSVKKMHVIPVDDVHDDAKWVEWTESLCPSFDTVFTGNDWVKRLFEEKGYDARPVTKKHAISATAIRKLMLNRGRWEELVPTETIKVIREIDGVKRLKLINYGLPRPPTFLAAPQAAQM